MAEGSAAIDRIASAVAMLAAAALGLSAGAMLAEAAVLVPYWRALPPDAFLSWYRENASRLLAFFAPLEITAALLAVAAAALYRLRRRPGSGPLIIAAACALAVLAAFPLYFQKVNASFASGTIPLEHVADELTRWSSWHWSRTAIGVGALALALLAVRDGDPTGRRNPPITQSR